jgi:hypothetical protein
LFADLARIEERLTLDMYGHSDWDGNKAAAQQAGHAIEQAVEKAENPNCSCGK